MASLQVRCRLLSSRALTRFPGSRLCLSHRLTGRQIETHQSMLASCGQLDSDEEKENRKNHQLCPSLKQSTATYSNDRLLRNTPLSSRAACSHGHTSFSPLLARHLRQYSPHESQTYLQNGDSGGGGGLYYWTASSFSGYLRPPLSFSPLSPMSRQLTAGFHSSSFCLLPDKKQKPTIEKAVDIVKEKKKKDVVDILTKEPPTEVTKPSIARRVWDAVLHYYHGFRLLAMDIRVAVRLLRKTLRGTSLTRRESKQFRRTVGDIFRVVPFSVFVIVPFMEFLLPVYLWLFPSALPSTFQSKDSKEARRKKELKVKLQMATFLQDTVEEMAVTSKNPKKIESVQEFADFMKRTRTSGAQASTEEILKFSKLFEDELTLDNLSKKQLELLCKLLLLQPYGSSNFLRFQLRMKLRQLKADDLLIFKEGVDSMSVAELQSASQARGMRALGMSESRLKSQLQQWIELHLNQAIPASLLLLSRTLYLPESTETSDALKDTIATLPENIVEEVEVLVADTSGESLDNKTRLELLRKREQLIQEEEEEKKKEKAEQEVPVSTATAPPSEKLQDKAPIVTPITGATPIEAEITSPSETISTTAPPTEAAEEESITAEELRGLSDAVTSLRPKKVLNEELEELKEDREEYIHDVEDLAKECEDELQESKASVRLGRKVDAMIARLDEALQTLEDDLVSTSPESSTMQMIRDKKSDVITTKELEEALATLKEISGEAKVQHLVRVLDEDHDGNIKLEELGEIVESLALEDTDIKADHIALIIDLIKKEDLVTPHPQPNLDTHKQVKDTS